MESEGVSVLIVSDIGFVLELVLWSILVWTNWRLDFILCLFSWV